MSNPQAASTPPPTPTMVDLTFTARDAEHLRTLSIFYYVMGGLGLVLSCLPLFYMSIGLGFMVVPTVAGAPPEDALAGSLFGFVFVVMAGFFFALTLLFAGLKIYAGQCLATQRHYMFCMVMAALECSSMPLGTILGVFTILVLARPSVKARFDALRARR